MSRPRRLRILRRAAVVAFVALAPIGVLLVTDSDAPAQPRGNAPKPGAGPRPGPPKRPPTTSDASSPTPTATSPTPIATAAATASAAGAKDTADAGVIDIKRYDGGSQTIKFGELEIEGRLKSPQLVYFLRRVRAEFAAGDLGHRSFMGELSETRKDPSF